MSQYFVSDVVQGDEFSPGSSVVASTTFLREVIGVEDVGIHRGRARITYISDLFYGFVYNKKFQYNFIMHLYLF